MQQVAIAVSCQNTLRKNGFRLTPQRRLLMDIIHNTHRHLRAEEILAYVRARVPGVNKSTIYRTLDLLVSLGCVVKSELKDRFIYHHAEEGHHHHLVCLECGKILDCSEGVFSDLEREISDKYGFQGDFRHMVIGGICEECDRMGR